MLFLVPRSSPFAKKSANMSHQARRMFRGRGGPTDGRLPPKRNPRRRNKPASNKYEVDGESGSNREGGGEVGDHEIQQDDSSSSQPEEVTTNIQAEDEPGQDATAPSDTTQETSNPCVKEIEHLRKRIRNLRENMQLSHSIATNLQTYQGNVLNAVVNCVNEWRSIVKHYELGPENDETPNDSSDSFLPRDLWKPTALAVFEMIQHAVQCGPLAGAKPGYFKRCGGEVAKLVAAFLDQVIPDTDDLNELMGFSSKQLDAMETWRKNAEKAALENKPPSRTALQQQQGKGKGKKAKKKMKG